MQQVTVTVQKRRRGTPKPTVEISRYKAKQLIKKAEIKVEEGECYVIYNCGHVFDNRDDPQITTYYIGENRTVRSCPICQNQKLVTKYKLCGCGAEHTGKRVQPSPFCFKCSPLRRSTGRTERLDAHLRNGHLADHTRGFCIHRSDCLKTYLAHDCVPCKGCKQYAIEEGEYGQVLRSRR